MLLLLLMFDLLSCSNADIFSLVVPDGDISAQLGSSVVLPCELSTSLDIRRYEVRWHRPDKFENPVLLYRDLKVQENIGDPRYRGRASLIGELQKWNASLRLENLTVADRGEYVCYVKSYTWYEEASVFLSLPVVGSPLLLSFAEAGQQVNVTCASGGWSPKPTLTWRDKQGRELTDSVNQEYTDSERLVNVSSWLLFSPSETEWISCSVGLSGQEMRESRVLPLNPVHHPADPPTEPGVSPGWKVATILLVISLLVLTVMTVFFLKFRGHIFQKGTKSRPAAEEEGRCFVGPETNNKETNADQVADLSPLSCPVCAVREANRTDGATQISGPETAEETSPHRDIQALTDNMEIMRIS
ncbi:butyrophilin subfamily 1 member A1-like isoform X2 [Pygocentrus nattereri]|uniref:butyrophilin subfamily 1 member A1-like isoform X2 n=1 Tax=Pygocentrus nattereri TaxID=42514 RepID=UPI001891EE8A|nr:butyrophilin subfamily 1 member A1-like isoform X2 [Pygocentrus nattereri]